jgi:dihydrofolate reductase
MIFRIFIKIQIGNFLFKKIKIQYKNINLINTMKTLSLIIAVDNENGIWKDNQLIWHIPEDMKFFKHLTTHTIHQSKQNAVIMGRKTWESLPTGFRPLPWRCNIVLSSWFSVQQEIEKDVLWFPDFSSLYAYLSKNEKIESLFIIWWAQLYNTAVNMPNLKKAYITRVYDKFHCDVFFDGLPLSFDETSRSWVKEYKWTEYEMFTYEKKKSFFSKIKNMFIK